MLKVNFYDLGTIEDEKLKYAVIAAQYNGKWIFVKHKARETWEIPGGHREEKEDIHQTAARELFEETGARVFTLLPVCTYSVARGEDESFGQLFYAKIDALDKLPDSEIGTIAFGDVLPECLTYPLIQPFLFDRVKEFLVEGAKRSM